MNELHRDGDSAPGFIALILCALTAMQVVHASGPSAVQMPSDRCTSHVVGSGSSRTGPEPTDWIGSWVTACLASDGRMLDISVNNSLDTQVVHAHRIISIVNTFMARYAGAILVGVASRMLIP